MKLYKLLGFEEKDKLKKEDIPFVIFCLTVMILCSIFVIGILSPALQGKTPYFMASTGSFITAITLSSLIYLGYIVSIKEGDIRCKNKTHINT